MQWLGKWRWILVTIVALFTASAGLFLGRMKEGSYIDQLYARSDFILVDEKGEFFQLSKFSKNRLLLLIFTPDVMYPALVAPFRSFSEKIEALKKIGVDVMMVTRMNKEIVRNFTEASRFPSRLLIDTGGSVGRNVGIWPGFDPVKTWGYVLMDYRMQIFWASTESKPMTYDELLVELKKVSGGDPNASSSTSSGSP